MTEERITSSTGGQKCSKLARFDLLDSSFLWKVAEVMGYGCGKYTPHNWRLGYDWGLSMAACQRHLHQFWQGEDLDQESGLPHLAHACFHLMVMYCFSQGIQYKKFDSRFLSEMDLTLGLEGLLEPTGEAVLRPDFPREVAGETIKDLEASLADTTELPVARPDSTNVFFTDEEMVAKLHDMALHSPNEFEREMRKQRAVKVGDRMEQVLAGLKGDTR